jgi:hypothetical protein
MDTLAAVNIIDPATRVWPLATVRALVVATVIEEVLVPDVVSTPSIVANGN